MFLCSQETVLLYAHNSCQMAKRVQQYNRGLIRQLIDDEAGAPDTRSDIEDLFSSTDEDEEVSSCIEDELVDSEDESCSPNGTTVVTTEATVLEDVSQVTPKQRKILKSFNVPGYAQYPLSAWSLTVTKIGADIALATLDAVFNFIVAFCNRGGLSTEVDSRAHR